MTKEEMISEYASCREAKHKQKELFLELETASAEELLTVREDLEPDIVQKSGLKTVKTVEKLLQDKKQLWKAVSFFAEMSVYDACIVDDEIDGDAVHTLQMNLQNCWLFPCTLLMWVIALLWHVRDDEPTSLHLCFTEETDVEALMSPLGEYVLPLFPKIKAIYTSVNMEEQDEAEEEDDLFAGVTVQTERPMPEEDFDTIVRLLRDLNDEPELYLTVAFDDMPLTDPIAELQVCADEDGYNIAIVYDLSETDPEQEQRVLAGGMKDIGAVEDAFRQICVDGVNSADIPWLAEFEDITE